MSHDRLHAARFARIVASLPADEPILRKFCEASRVMLDVEGVAITMGYDRPERLPISSTSHLARRIDDAQEVVGQGPAFDALATQDVVSASFGGGALTPWPALADSVARMGFEGIIVAVPVTVADHHLGVLTAHTTDARWSIDLDAATYLSRALGPVLGDHLGPTAVEDELGDDWHARAVVNQATGMVVFQLGIRTHDALTLLRAHAYASETTLLDVATLVVERQLELDSFSTGGER